MCRSREDGGRRCEGLHLAERRAKRRAAYAAAKTGTRRDPVFDKVEALPTVDELPSRSPAVNDVNDDDTVYEPITEGAHTDDSPVGQRLNSVCLQWERQGFDDGPACGLRLRDYGSGESRDLGSGPRPDSPLYGFEDRAGREWIATYEVHDWPKSMNGEGEWHLTEVTGRYEAGRSAAVEALITTLGDQRSWWLQFHRGPDRRERNRAADTVASELGDRWVPAYMETSRVSTGKRSSRKLLTVYSCIGELLARQELVGASLTASSTRQAAASAGWLAALDVDPDDATTIHTGLARIPVAVKDALAYAEWLGDNNATTVPVQEWLVAGGLKAEAATAAVGRQLIGPSAT